MKKATLLLFLVLFLGMGRVQAQPYRNALGIRLSSNDAAVNHSVSFKHFFKPQTAVEALLSFDGPLALGLLFEKHKPLQPAGLSWLYGGGAYVAFEGRRVFGGQGILGLDYVFPSAPVNLSVDWKPELNFMDEVSFEPAAVGFSVRFAF